MERPSIHIAARVPASLAHDLTRLAERQDRSFSAELRQALRAHLAQNDDEAPGSASVAQIPAWQEPVDGKV